MPIPLIPFNLWLTIISYRLSPLILLFFSTACSLPPTKVKFPVLPPPETRATQTGIASWYGPGFHGQPTASGVIYDQHELTAAHQTLPLGTRVMVTNLNNGRSSEVTINDRGPFAKGRIIDLSYAAAQILGMIGPGTIPVRVEVVDSGPHKIQMIPQSLDYTLQAGSFADLERAQRLKEQLAKSYPHVSQVSIVPVHGADTIYYRVQLGTFTDRREAEGHAHQLAGKGFPVIIMEK
ncbi:MAG: septal ring lytic transglycosylase RlpA family protein [Candidatus Binatia bacterium]